MPLTEPKTERNYCSRLGFALLFAVVWAIAWQTALVGADFLLVEHFGVTMPDTVFYLLALVGHYLVSLPAGFALCRTVPRMPFTPTPPDAGRFGRWCAMGIALMWLGSLVGSALSGWTYRLSGREPVEIVNEAFSQYPLSAVLLGACVIGPVCEELLFRRLVAGRLARYGEKPAAFVSALLFALYHGNLEQFFYAFALGLLLAYVYFRTGQLAAPIALHMVLNWYGSGIPSLLPDSDAILVLYGMSWLVLTASGLALFARRWRHQVWLHGVSEPSMRTVFGNAGMVLALVACFVQTVINFVLT